VLNMVQGKKPSDMSNSNGTPKSKYQQPNMAFPRKDISETRGGSAGTNDGRVQNGESSTRIHISPLTTPGNASSFRTDSAISGGRNQGERVLQRWVPDAPEDVDGSLESTRMKSAGGWDQFAENGRLFGLKTDYDENIYTTTIDKNHPQYKQRVAEAERKAREIERSAATNSHVEEERVTDNVTGGDIGGDEEDKYVDLMPVFFILLTSL
jgi:PAB1-binding protein PBP1